MDVSSICLPGARHRDRGEMGEDALALDRTRHRTVAAVADGLGAAAWGGQAAAIAAACACRAVVVNLDLTDDDLLDRRLALRASVERTALELEAAGSALAAPAGTLATTVGVLAVTSTCAGVACCGDVMAALVLADGEVLRVTDRSSVGTATVTLHVEPLTTVLVRRRVDVHGIVLATDGLEALLDDDDAVHDVVTAVRAAPGDGEALAGHVAARLQDADDRTAVVIAL